MSEQSEKAKVLASLAALNTQTITSVSDEDIAAFVDGSLSPADKQRVMKSMAQDPTLLAHAVRTRQAKEILDSPSAALDNNKSGESAFLKWLKSPWFTGSSAGGAVLAAGAYFALVPSVNLSDVEQQIQHGYTIANLDLVAQGARRSNAKSFDFDKHENQQDYTDGMKLAANKLQLTSAMPSLRTCVDSADCHKQQTLLLLGQWNVISNAQCDSPYSANLQFWQGQASSYVALRDVVEEYGFSLEPLTTQNEKGVCHAAKQLKELGFK